MRHSGPAAYEPAHFFVSFLCANKEMKNTFTMLFIKAKFCFAFRKKQNKSRLIVLSRLLFAYEIIHPNRT